jgi:hypothetical protein
VLLATKSRWRYFVLLHPVLTLAAIVLTANHYWLDAVAAAALFGVALGVDHFVERHHTRKVARRADGAGGSSDSSAACRARTPHGPTVRPAGRCGNRERVAKRVARDSGASEADDGEAPHRDLQHRRP